MVSPLDKTDDKVKCVLPSVRSKAGCKDPTHFFTTNSSEPLNHLIKQEVQWKESQLPKLIDSLKVITNDHYSELEKAVLNNGQWHFTALYASVTVKECGVTNISESTLRNIWSKHTS